MNKFIKSIMVLVLVVFVMTTTYLIVGKNHPAMAGFENQVGQVYMH